MISEITIALALQSRAPRVLSPARVHYLAGAIARIAATEEDAAALLTNGHRESWWSYVVETCAIEGIGGWGTFGVAGFWGRWFPRGTCGPIDVQANASRRIWLAGYRVELRPAFGHYIGAKRYRTHPEAFRRVALFYSYKAMLQCDCSI